MKDDAALVAPPEGGPSAEVVDLAEEVDLTLGGHPAYKLTISSGRVHALAKEVLRLAGKRPYMNGGRNG